MTRRSFPTSSNTPDPAAASAATAVTESSDVAREITLVPAALDSATPAALLTGAIDVEQMPCPPSVFDPIRIGIGSSSSHTVGPMWAGRAFSRALAEAVRPDGAGNSDGECASSAPGTDLPQPSHVTVELCGSLGAAGREHAADRAAVMGPTGYEPETVPAVVCKSPMGEVEAVGELVVDGVDPIPFSPSADIHFLPGRVLPYHANGTTLTAYCASGAEILRRTHYSVGGGFAMEDVGTPGSPSIQVLATASVIQAHATPAPFPFTASTTILAICEREGLSVSDVALANELSARNREEVTAYLDRLCATMRACIEAGMNVKGILPGGLGVHRRAKVLHERLCAQSTGLAAAFTMADPSCGMDWADLFALAVNEENVVGCRVVIVPTNVMAGIVPAVLAYYGRFIPGADDNGVRRFLPVATAVGGLIKTNALIARTEVGCQGEVGSVSSMAAAGLTEAPGGTPAQIKNIAGIAMEHNLGPTCDPVGGLVQIPCIECNAVATVKTINAARIALWGEGRHAVSLDTVIETMRQTGEDMLAKYKETSRDGLAVNVVKC